jgi:hypothetical protein
MIRVPFIDASAKIASIIIKTGQDDPTPRKIKLVSELERETPPRLLADSKHPFFKFVNQDTLDFGDAKDRPCAQELDVPISNDLGEYALRYIVPTVEGLYLCTYALLDLPNSRMSGASPFSYMLLMQTTTTTIAKRGSTSWDSQVLSRRYDCSPKTCDVLEYLGSCSSPNSLLSPYMKRAQGQPIMR